MKQEEVTNNSNEISYKKLFEKAGDAIFRGDKNGNFTHANIAASKLTGYSQEELLNMNMKDIFSAGQLEKKPLQYSMIENDKPLVKERLITTKTGKHIYVEMNSTKMDNDSYLSIFRDISYRKNIENKLRNSEEKFRKLFLDAPDGILSINSKGLITDCNQAYCNLLKSEKHEILNSHVSESICDKDKPLFIEKYPKLITTGKAESELGIITKENEVICTRRSVSALYDKNGKYTGAIVHTHDITDQKKAREEIVERETRLNAIFKAADNVSFILTTTEGTNAKILEYSPGSENIFGYSHDEIIGQPITILHTQDSINNFNNYLDKLKKGKAGYKGESTMFTKSGHQITVLHTAYPILNSDGELAQILAVTIDISMQKQLESQLRHSQKMEAVGLMASGIAHNFNNILQAVVGYVSFAKDGLNKDDQRYKDIEQISEHIKKATALTKELLAVGKEQLITKQEVNLLNILVPIINLITRRSKNKIVFSLKANESSSTVYADEKQIDQVMRNIIINAEDAMPNGGKIEIVSENVLLNDEFCFNNAWAKQGRFVKISISDTGHGMDKQTLNRIFEPYFTTKEVDKGTGLGLSTAFGIISQHEGLFNAESVVNKGSKFDIYLPSN